MRAFVTGVTGFAGTHLAEHLLECGDTVVGTATGSWRHDAPAALRRSMEVLRWDVSQPADDALRRRMDDLRPDAFFHLAALSVPGECGAQEPTPAALAVNVRGTEHAIDLAAGRAARFLYVGSCYVYAPVETLAADPTTPVPEDAPLAPSDGYGRTKLAAERLVAEAVAAGRLDAVIARAFQHTGPRHSPRMMLPGWVRQFVQSADPIQVGSFDTYLDLSDVRDVVRAYRRLMVEGVRGGVYNVGTGQVRRSGDIFALLRNRYDPARPVVERSPGRRLQPIADNQRLLALGWQPEISLERTLDDLIEYWKGER